ncbi:putative polyketide synthase [Streptomyces spiralis]|uniref:Polyketide synthase n=1 Tax=Streptomyces spiralis TaxID=66376 RepID=A0A919A3Q9_9ACTN|nr:type I polyketide synthase [Streptomyces spiralis]GHE84111.1 putative polyketide synthase [Streptomyces spiralis]
MEDIAIVGLDCAFPGAADADAYWDLLMRGGDAIGSVPARRWDPDDFPGVPGAGGFLDDADVFDADFFSVSPREAAAMDPHHRLLLHSAWRALEDSGRAPGDLAGSDTGVFVGMMGGEWGRLTMGTPARATPQLGAGSSNGMAANRISYHFNLTGPSLAVDTACSSSLVAVHLAAGALRAGECDTALAGGVNVLLSPSLGLVYAQMGLAASDGRCKPFSADADGIGRSEGVGLVVLRRLSDAVADGQRIYAVLRGSAVNQDGRSNGVTAPNRWSQQAVVQAAYRRAGITPDQVAFVEAHGTGTVLGDTIECAALGSVHGVPRPSPCALGSVKGNLGHLEGAAGIAALIKTALALHHRVVPASRFADRENPQLQLAARGMRLLKSPLRLPAGETVAAVSSFGMGGTNTHAVLATAPRPAVSRSYAAPAGASVAGAAPRSGETGVFTLSADTPEALRRNLLAQAEDVAGRPPGDAARLCWSSNRIKTGLPYRFAVTARDSAELADALRGAAADDLPATAAPRPWARPVVAFLFTGQGSVHAGMTAPLYRDSPLYRRHLDEVDAALAPHLGASVREVILGGGERVHEPAFAQPALFAVGCALARTLAALGVTPAAVLGHSLGEYAAAVTAGALDLDEAARLVVRRAAVLRDLPHGGGMLAVRAGAEPVAELLAGEPEVRIAALNGPSDTVLSGPREALSRLERALGAHGVDARPLDVTHAFHAPPTAPMAEALREESVQATAPTLPFASTRYGRMLREEPLDGAYWADQAAQPVLFDAALGALVAETFPTHLLEIGPRPQLLPLAGRAGHAAGLEGLHPAPGPEATGRELAETVAALHRAGLDPVWDALYAPGHRAAERLRPYVFCADHHYWDRQSGPAPAPASATRQHPGTPSPEPHPPTRPEHAPGPEKPGLVETGLVEPGPAEPELTEAGPVLAAVVDAVVEVGGHPRERVLREARFYEDLGFDSVMIMQLKSRVESRLPQIGEVSVQQLLPALRSVGTLADFLDDMVMAGAA